MKKKKAAKQSLPKSYVPALFFVSVGFLTLFLPFFYLNSTLDETLMPRMFALSTFLLLFSFAFFNKKIFRQLDLSLLRQKIFYVLVSYFLITLVSAVFAYNKFECIFDIVKTFAFVTLVAMFSILFAGTGNWQEKLPKLVLFAAFASCIIGFVQYYNRVFLSPSEFMPDGRRIVYAVDGIMSHKNLFSLSLMMMLPFVGYGTFVLRKWWRFAAIVTVVMLFVMIVLLQTRAVWSGLIISFAIGGVLLVVFAKKFGISNRWRYLLLASGFALVAGVGLLVLVSGKDSQNPYIKQLKSITDTKSDQNTYRLKTWVASTEMIRDNFVTGVGAGNWNLIVPKYFAGKFTEKEELNWLRPHNDYLWVMSEKGILGIILFLSIFGFVMFYLIRVIKNAIFRDKVLALLLLMGIISYMVDSGFDFPYERVFHQSFLSLLVAASIALHHKIKPAKPLNISRIPVFVAFVAIMSFSVFFSFSTVRQEIYVKKVWVDNQAKDWQNMLRHAKLAESPVKNMDPLANPIASYIGLAYTELNELPKAVAAFEEAYRIYPNKLKGVVNLALLYEKTGKYKEAEACLMWALVLIPNQLEIQKKLCDIYYASGRYKEAILAFKNIPGWEKDSSMVQNIRLLESLVKPTLPEHRKKK